MFAPSGLRGAGCKTLCTTLFEPFEILRSSNQEIYRKESEKLGAGRDLGIWLPGMLLHLKDRKRTAREAKRFTDSPPRHRYLTRISFQLRFGFRERSSASFRHSLIMV